LTSPQARPDATRKATRDNLATPSPGAHPPATDHHVTRDPFANALAEVRLAERGGPGHDLTHGFRALDA
jgi:hypothetical protein